VKKNDTVDDTPLPFGLKISPPLVIGKYFYHSEQEGWLPPTKRASAVKTRMNGLSCGEKIMIIRSAVLIQYQRVTDRLTDGQNLDS